MQSSPNILIAPLDWGMGHTTRVIPIGRELMLRNARLFIAGNPWQLQVLSEAFPQATQLLLEGYQVTYGKRFPASWHVARQFPRLRKVIRSEHEWTSSIVDSYGIDAILSDNRYGVWHPGCKNAMVIHQLIPPLKFRPAPLKRSLWQLHRRFLAPFQDILIPDQAGQGAMASSMLPDVLPPHCRQIGWLSRLQGMIPQSPDWLPDTAPDLLVLLSGPEPQRSMLEETVRREIASMDGACWIVQGLPGAGRLPRQIPGGLLIPYLDAPALAYWLPKAGAVLARSGYSSLMDFATLGLRRVIVVPTPGQPEQQFLARSLKQKGKIAVWQPGKQPLIHVVDQANRAAGFRADRESTAHLRAWVGEWLR